MTNNQTNPPGDSGKDGESKDNKKKILDPPTIESVAQLIKTGKVKQIVVMAGAGISTAAGIPDFRTPGTGLYDNLQKYNLPYPEAIFDMAYFNKNPEPFFSLARELFPGNFMPTLTHYFFTLLYRKNILLRCFTQNIDTLERLAGLPDEMVVEAHGSFAKSRCLRCKKSADFAWIKEKVNKGEIPICTLCKVGVVKPCITFFGEALPEKFFLRLKDFRACDLLIVIGTSLQVQPFAGLIDYVGEEVPRLLINLEKVGDTELSSDMGFDFEGKYQEYRRDAFYKGTCDEGVKKLAELCGFKDELLQIYEEGHESLIKELGKIPTPVEIAAKATKAKPKPKVEDEDEVDKLAKVFEDKIKIKSEISEEVDQMLKEFEELKEKKSNDKELLKEKENGNKSDDKDDKELLNVKEDITKSDKEKEKEKLKDIINNENSI